MDKNRIGHRARRDNLRRHARTTAQAASGIPAICIDDSARIAMLRQLLPISEPELRTGSKATDRKILSHLRTALRRERCQGRAGHWTYDLNRHIALSQALKMELQRQSFHSHARQ
ncbi:MAG: hypothetical protein K8F25_06720 [Fimbriimonadaceae bacterium]|nr:hypothetical protein [Alphaproteobacteria bacterium]